MKMNDNKLTVKQARDMGVVFVEGDIIHVTHGVMTVGHGIEIDMINSSEYGDYDISELEWRTNDGVISCDETMTVEVIINGHTYNGFAKDYSWNRGSMVSISKWKYDLPRLVEIASEMNDSQDMQSVYSSGKESEYDKGMRECVKDIARIIGLNFPANIGYGNLADEVKARIDGMDHELERAIKSLEQAGFIDNGGEHWKPPVHPAREKLIKALGYIDHHLSIDGLIDRVAEMREELDKSSLTTSERDVEGALEWKNGDKCSYNGCEGLVIGWHQLQEIKVQEEIIKEITVENFDYSNLKKWIKGFSHKDKVEIAVYSAELVIDLYDGVSDAPKVAIQAAKDWLLNPIKENKDKCISAAYAAADVAAYATADAAATAAYAYAADDAAAATATAAASAHNSLEIKGKIVDFILILIDKEKQESKQSEIDSAAQQVESLSKESECNDEGEIEWRSGDKCSYKGYEGLVIGWHPEQPVIVIETSEHGVICVAMSLLSKQLTPEQKQQQIDELNGKKFYDIQHDIADVDMWDTVDIENKHYWIEFAKKVSFEGKIEGI